MWDHGVPTNVVSSWGRGLQTENRFAYCYGKLAIDSDGLEYLVIIGRFAFQIGRAGDFHYCIKNREISRQIGRLGRPEALKVKCRLEFF